PGHHGPPSRLRRRDEGHDGVAQSERAGGVDTPQQLLLAPPNEQPLPRLVAGRARWRHGGCGERHSGGRPGPVGEPVGPRARRGGLARGTATAPPAPAPPPLQNKFYVAMFMSDGDNLQEDEGLIPLKWWDGARGQVPISWTVSPALVDVAPGILRYYQSTAT